MPPNFIRVLCVKGAHEHDVSNGIMLVLLSKAVTKTLWWGSSIAEQNNKLPLKWFPVRNNSITRPD